MDHFAKLLSSKPAIAPSGYSPAQLRSAYGVSGNAAARIAIVDAYGDPTIKADLDTYSRTFGLSVMPVCGSVAQTSCFNRIDQRGGVTLPKTNTGWAVETALDVEAAHAICPGCRIDLIETDTAATSNLLAGVDRAVIGGAQVVSMSWGGSETTTELKNDAHFAHAGVTFVASSGDSGYGTSWPAASNSVIAVGGTTLKISGGNRAAETAWAGSGSGCSKYETKPARQHDSGCARRSVADVSADADPATGAAIYSTTASGGGGWFSVGGTSLAAPLVAAMVAMAGPTSTASVADRLYASLGSTRLYDVRAGTTGSCVPSYLCTAGLGYDGPSGLGSPVGLGAL